MTERAMWRQVGLGFRLDLKDTDPAFLPPPDSQRVVFLIDGLDEVRFTEAAIIQLFEHLRGQATGRHKVIVFSRPEVLPWKRLSELAIPVLELQPFSLTGDAGSQVGEWLGNWNRHAVGRPAISIDDITKRGVLELARTPILLFMIAETWDRVAVAGNAVRQADLYDAFLRQIARGKHEDDRDRHEPIAQAADHLQRRLVELGLVEPDASFEQAMLWALSRVAWESHCLEQRERPLTQRKMIDLLSRELALDDDADASHVALFDGVLLALQVDFSSSTSRILFGHRSFREFLVGHYWERTLLQIAANQSDAWRRVETSLLGGRLMGVEDRSFEFLIELLEHWDAAHRGTLRRWAEQVFNDERISQSDEVTGAVLYHDRRSHLREAALAIGSCVAGSTGIEARSTTALRSLLAWFWAQGKRAMIKAPGLVHTGAQLRGAQLFGADLRAADLRGADLGETELLQVDLSDAQLSHATLRGARINSSTLAGARLDHVRMHGASMLGVDLSGAAFTGSELTGGYIIDCILDGADLSGADLQGSMMNLSYALQVAKLEDCKLGQIKETLFGTMLRRSGLVGEIVEAVAGAGVSQLSWWNDDDSVEDRGLARDGEPTRATPPTQFRITVGAAAAEAVIAAVCSVPGVLSLTHSMFDPSAPR